MSRERMASDRRRVVVTLRPKSRKLLLRLRPLVEERYATLEAALGTRSMQDVYDALDGLLARTPMFIASESDEKAA